MNAHFDLTKYNKAEFRLVTVIFTIALLNLLTVAVSADSWLTEINSINSYHAGKLGLWFIRYTVLYAAYVLAHFVIVKKLVKDATFSNISLAAITVAGIVIIWTLAEIWCNYSFYYYFENIRYNINISIKLLVRNFLRITGITTLYIFYTLLKHDKKIAFLVNSVGFSSSAILRHCIIGFGLWFLIMMALTQPGLPDDYVIGWIITGIPAILIYAYSAIYLVPHIIRSGKGFWSYWKRFALIAICIFIFLCVFFTLLLGRLEHMGDLYLITFMSIAVQLIITVPACWFICSNRVETQIKITGLKTALGQSSANLDFLRSQINPHFLFNALNTLYGTAIQENADRTGEGIQKLGDMMRFMLHENTQEKISLMREVDYLKNYIDLQKLRTHASPEIVIQTEIEESVNGLQIAPMLLIPFVENAFKHGISLREPSHIKIALHTEGLKLFFDVYNSVHPKIGIDPEKANNGIGLENVKQRLQLLYPDKHELLIRETSKEYFIHLTIQL